MSHNRDNPDEDETAMLDPTEADEVIEDDGDVAMDSDEEVDVEQVIALQNDSSAHFDGHNDSIFCIAQHPTDPKIVATGGGDDIAYVFDTTPEPTPVLPPSYESDPQPRERKSLEPIAKLEGHKDSVNAITFTLPKGEFLATAGLDGQLLIWRDKDGSKSSWTKFASAQEVEEINWLAPCPSANHPNTIALGANDGSIWVYDATSSSSDTPLSIVQAYYLHSASSTAGAWTPDGSLLATISEDGSFYVWDPWGEAAAQGIVAPQGGQALVGLTADDERFKIEGGLYSIAISPGGTLAAVGGAEGIIRVVGLPKLQKAKGGSASASGQAGQILASLQAQTESVESISFSDPPTTLMASASVDGSIVLFDVAHRYAVRRKIDAAHDEEAVIKIEFARAGPRGVNSWILTSCGNDGVIRRWDCRGGTAAAAKGLIKEFKGHRGGGADEGGIMGFVQSNETGRIVTAGDDSVSLVFDAPF